MAIGPKEVVGKAGEAVAGIAGIASDAVKRVVPADGDLATVTPEQIQEVLDYCYGAAINGVPKVSRSVDDLAEDYLGKYNTVEDAARAMINVQLVKNTASGVLSGLAGFLTLPIAVAAIPANITNVIYVQMRMVVTLAKMGGYDVRSDQVQTLVYVCLTGSAASDILKDAGIKVAEGLASKAIQKIPYETIKAINKAVGMRLLTKFGETGVVNLGKLVPVAGGVVGGFFDFSSTKVIANVAYRQFVGGVAEDVVDEETIELVESLTS